MIFDFKARFPGVEHRAFVAGFLNNYRRHRPKELIILRFSEPGKPEPPAVKAQINAADLGGATGWQGRWIGVCECGGAEYVAAGEMFMCCSCWNRAHGGFWRPVRFPKDEDRARVEALLLKRPARNRNWEPQESLADLRAENRAHGIED